MKTKNYVKVGLVISIVLHVGIFALGGYVMNNITKELNEKSMLQSSVDEDITYVDIGITQEDESNDIVVEEAEDINAQSEIVVDEEELEKQKPPIETINPPEEKKPEPVVKKNLDTNFAHIKIQKL